LLRLAIPKSSVNGPLADQPAVHLANFGPRRESVASTSRNPLHITQSVCFGRRIGAILVPMSDP